MHKLHPDASARVLMQQFLASQGGKAHWHLLYQHLKSSGMGHMYAGHAVCAALDDGFLRDDGRGFVQVAPRRPAWYEWAAWVAVLVLMVALLAWFAPW